MPLRLSMLQVPSKAAVSGTQNRLGPHISYDDS
jgi:hypothetical protein